MGYKKVSIKDKLKAFLQDDSGATAIEYGLIAALIGIGMTAGLNALGGDNAGAWDDMAREIADAMDN